MKVCSVCRRCYEDAVLACSEENHGSLLEALAAHSEIIPNYKLEFLQDSTPAGETYRAVNTILKKDYLVRLVAPEAFDERARKQFLTEAQALAAIIHPNVVRVFESGTLSDGSLYAVTEFVAAQTLRECFENVGAPSEVTALTITRQAAEGLEALHAVGVFHRSIKPESIILTTDAENGFLVKLRDLDFGAIRQNYVIANPEQNIGELRYFSPEQCGAGDVVDAQTDIYSLGIVLYEALAGRVPFDSPYADALIKKQISEQPPEIKIHSFDLRMLLSHTLSDALQKQTRTRLKSANALARRIRHIEQLATHSSTPPPAVAYPARMNKAAVVFTPPAKVEAVEPPKIEALVADLPPAENIESAPAFEARAVVEEAENIAPVEAETFGESRFVTEDAALVEIPAAVEAEPEAAELPVVEYTFELKPLAEESTAVETPIVIEDAPALAEEAPENSSEAAFAETPWAAETVFESAPRVEARESIIEEPAVEAPEIEYLPAVEAQASFEDVIPVEAEAQAAFEDQPIIEVVAEPQPEEALPVEARTEAADIVSAEPSPEDEQIFEDAAAPDAAPAEPVFIDYTTTKLPPVEAVLGKLPPESIIITEIEPIFSLKRGIFDIHKTSEPAKIDWEQPDDVPTTTQALNFNKKLSADVAFRAPKTNIVEDEVDDVIEAGDVDSAADFETEDYEPHQSPAAERAVFSYDDSRTTWSLPEWNLPDKRKVLTGAGIFALLVVAVGGTLLSRQFLTARASQQTTAQSSTTDKTQPKTAEPAKVPETTSQPVAVKPEAAPVVNPSADDAAIPELPDFQPRGETDAKAALPVAQENRGKKRVLKEAVEKLERTVETKPAATKTATVSAPVFDKKGNIKPPSDKKATTKNQVSTPAKNDIFTRPRIVKTQ